MRKLRSHAVLEKNPQQSICHLRLAILLASRSTDFVTLYHHLDALTATTFISWKVFACRALILEKRYTDNELSRSSNRDIRAAIKYYSKALHLCPTLNVLYLKRCRLLALTNELIQCSADLESAVKLGLGKKQVRLTRASRYLASMLKDTSDFQHLSNEYARALEDDVLTVAEAEIAVKVFLKCGRHSLADAVITDTFERGENARVLVLRAKVRSAKQDYVGAARDSKTALKFDSTNTILLHLLGMYRYKANAFKGLHDVTASIWANSDNSETYLLRAQYFANQGIATAVIF